MDGESRVDSFTTPLDAELAKVYLESYGIEVRLEGEMIMGAVLALGPMWGGVWMYVREKDEPPARELLGAYHQQLMSERAQHQESPEQLVDRAWRASLLGLAFLPVVLHLYSMARLLSVHGRVLSPKAHFRYQCAWAIDLLMIFLFSWLIVRFAMRI
jgi:hypothetical protein